MEEISRNQVSPLRRYCESRVGLVSTMRHRESSFHHCGGPIKLVMCQETSRKQFSPLWRSCEARTGLFKCKDGSREQFAVMLVQARLSAKKDQESSFNHWGGPVKLLQSRLCAGKHRQRILLHCGSPSKLVQAWLRTRGHLESSFHH